jgi:hypothetical protein
MTHTATTDIQASCESRKGLVRELRYKKQGSSGDKYEAQLAQGVGANRKHARREVVSSPCTKPSIGKQAEVADCESRFLQLKGTTGD